MPSEHMQGVDQENRPPNEKQQNQEKFQIGRRSYLKGALTAGLFGIGVSDLGVSPVAAQDARFYTDGPPERSGRQINATDYSSLQAAHDALKPDDTLYIPQSGGPYQDRLRLDQDHVTIASDGARIEQPDTREPYVIGCPRPSHTPDTSLVSPAQPGDDIIRVADASAIQPGDDVYIAEQRRPFGEPPSGGAGGPYFTREYRHVTSVDGDQLSLHHPLFLPYPGEAATQVGVIDWTARDVHLTGFTLQGIPGADAGSEPLKFRGIRDGWIDNLTINDAGDDSIVIKRCFRTRTDQIEIYDGNGYGINVSRGSTHTLCTNTLGDGISSYVVRAGMSATDTLIEGMTGRNITQDGTRPVIASHWGGFQTHYRNVRAEGEQLVRFRTPDMTVSDFEVTGCGGTEIVWSQRPFNVVVENGTIGDYPANANEIIFYFRLRGDNSPYGNEAAENITIRNIEIEQFRNHGPEDIGSFHENAIIDGLHIENVTYGGERLRREHVEAWSGYRSADISDLSVE